MKKIVGVGALLSVLVMEGALLTSVPYIFDMGMAALLTATTPARTPPASSPTSADSGSRRITRTPESFHELFYKGRVLERWLSKA